MEMITSITYKGKRAALGSFMDITEHKRTEDELRRSEGKYRTIMEDMEEGYFEIDLAGNFTFVNDAECRNMGYSREELIGMNNRQYTDEENAKKAFQAFSNLYKTGDPCKIFDYEVTRKDGTKVIAELLVSLIKDSKGKPIGFRGLSRHITERKRMEDELRQSEEKYRTILENIEDGYAEMDLNGNFIFFNEALCRIQGYPREELIKKNYHDLMDEENAKKIFERYNKVFTTGESEKEVPYEIITKSGIKRHIETSITPMKDAAGRVSAFRGIVRDITERKQAEEALVREKKFFDAVVNSSPGLFFVFDDKGNIIQSNKNAEKVTGYSTKEISKMNILDFVAKEDQKAAAQAMQEVFTKGQSSLETNILSKLGKKTPFYITGLRTKFENTICVVCTGSDITERKQTEEALQKSEERYRNILESIQEGYFEIDLESNYTFANEANARFLGYTKEELIGMNTRQHMDEETYKQLSKPYSELYRTGIPIESLEAKSIRKDGSNVIYDTSVSLIRDKKGNPIGFRGVSRDVTERKQHEEELSLLRSAMDVSQDMIFLVDRTTMRFLYANETAFRLTGYTREEYVKKSPQDMLLVDRKTLEDAYDEAIAAAPTGITVEMKTRRKDGTRTIIELHRRALNIGNRWIIVTIVHDISQRWLAEEKIRLLGRMFAALSATNETILHSKSPEELYQRVCNAAVDDGKFITTGVLLFDPETTWVRVAAASGDGGDRLREVRISLDESIPEGKGMVGTAFRTGKPCVSNDYLNDPVSLPWREIMKNVGAAAVIPLISGGQSIGALIFYATQKRSFDDEAIKLLERMAENVVFALGNFEREAERQRAEDRIQHLATHDALTGLPNRLMFSQLLNHAIQSAKRYKRQLAVFFIDLDRFKTINDTLGHDAGDQLLQEIAIRFKQSLRAADVIARLGGDEFVILIEEVSDSKQVATVAHKILAAAIKPIVLLGEECRVTASIGISIYSEDAEDEQSLMKNADIAMYHAKEEGKNNYQFYSKDIQSRSIERLSIETNLRFALERNELSLHYQAKVDFKTNAINGVEALLRWQNPYLGSVTPTQFIPVAEESGLIIPIGKWVIRTACAQNVAWQRDGLPPICMAVNLSLRQLMDEFLIEDIKKALNDCGMAPNLLELEITESMVMHNPTRMIAVLAKIKELGVRLAIDDFGTGYSSLGQLKHFPIDTLKVDRSFVRNIPQDAEDKAITEAIIAMGKTLSLTVVAEGVETVEQMNFLKDHSCDEMQGFYFSKPIAPDQFAELLRNHVPSPKKERLS
ncbi:MAG: hypothetical protein A2W27_08005 [Deltaproteobacteria bacterium RBG_16_44_11]|nr:MAG: hypothetical protein A2W27_08005 [Deltaproteobacteria bacterium RBG_16_44_11]